MSENLSIDEIIKQAEEIRKKTVKKAHSALEEINTSANEVKNKTIEVPSAEPKNIEIPNKSKASADSRALNQKTAVVNTKAVKQSDNEKTRIIGQKTIAVNLNEKTGVITSTDNLKSVKKSFFKKSEAEPIYSKLPPEIIEKPATIKSKSRFDKTADLQEIPTIVAVDELENTKISFNNGSFYNSGQTDDAEEGCQIVLDGFEDSTEEMSKIDEDVAERQLLERRKDKVNKFRLFAPEEVETSNNPPGFSSDSYENSDEKTAMVERLFAIKSSITVKTIITFIVSIPLALITVFKDSSYLPSFLLDDTAYLITVLVLFVLVLLTNIKYIIHGFNFKGGINFDFPISAASVFIAVHTALLLADSDLLIDNGAVYPLAIAFAFLMGGMGKSAMITRVIKNFEFLSNQNENHTVETIANTVDATIISRGLLTGDANLKTSIKTDHTTKFLDISCSDEPANNIAKTTGVIMLALSAVLFIAFSIFEGSWHIGFNIAACAVCISLPCISLFMTNNVLTGVSDALEKKGAMINGFKGAQMVDDANAIVIEAQDLFRRNSCEIHGIKTFNGAKADDVILQTAAVIINTKSPLASVFDDVIIGKQTILPDVDGIVYEDRLGTSAWIYRKKILVGTRELLLHHGVSLPREEFETKYTRKGRKILYLAVAGKAMAMFVVSYNADPQLKKSLRKLEKSGITILVKSADPYINDESIAELFSLPEGFVRVMNTSNGRAFEKYSDMCVETSPAYVVHNGTALGFVSAMSGADNLEETRRLLSVLISFGCAIGFGVVVLLGIIGGLSQLNAVNVIIFQSIWCIFMLLVSKIKRLGL